MLQKLAGRMRNFVYDPSKSFRGYLRTLTENAWAALVKVVPGLTLRHAVYRRSVMLRLERSGPKAREEFISSCSKKRPAGFGGLLPRPPWDAYRLTAIDGLSGADAARQLGVKVSTVFVAKSRVLARLKEEVKAWSVLMPSESGPDS